MNIYEQLKAVLKGENSYITDKGDLKKQVVINDAMEGNDKLLDLLIGDKDLKAMFFKATKSSLIFKQQEFVNFLQMEMLDKSYTAYAQKIGLKIDGKFLKQNNDVELVWPYKDCILEGGQTKEEQKRDEIFFNKTIAQDEITQLLEPKVFTNAKRYDASGNTVCTSLNRDADTNRKRGLPEDTITDNLIIKGNNLLALHSLKEQFAGKVKLIYIDPPFYFNGTKDSDSFKYNTNFKLSTWLTFLKNRLDEAKLLLKDDGFMVVHVGALRQAYVNILLDEVFGSDNLLHHIAMTTTEPTGFKTAGDSLVSTINNLFIYKRNNGLINKLYVKRDYDTAYKYVLLNPEDDYRKWKYKSIKEYLKDNHLSSNQEDVEKFALAKPEVVFRTTAITGGAFNKRKETIQTSRNNKGKVYRHPNDDEENFYTRWRN